MSDQDFFFDEEDEKPAAEQKAVGASTPKAGAKAAAPSNAEPVFATGSFLDQSVTMSVAALLVVCGLLVGVILGIFVGQSRANSGALSPGIESPSGQAPQLTPDQLDSGELPPGHPSVGGTATPSETATQSETTTSGE